MLGKVLAGLGEIFFSSNGPEALAMIRNEKPDLMLLDTEAAGGLDLLAAIKQDEACKHIPVLFITAATGIDHETRGLEAGAG